MNKKNSKNWERIKKSYSKGQIIHGKVFKVEPFGVFIDFGEEFYGLALIPYVSNKVGITIDEFPSIGSSVQGVILDFYESLDDDLEFNYISLDLREGNTPLTGR